MNGTITQLEHHRGVGALVAEDDRHYMFRRADVRNVWFHDLTAGMAVVFEPTKDFKATNVRPLNPSE